MSEGTYGGAGVFSNNSCKIDCSFGALLLLLEEVLLLDEEEEEEEEEDAASFSDAGSSSTLALVSGAAVSAAASSWTPSAATAVAAPSAAPAAPSSAATASIKRSNRMAFLPLSDSSRCSNSFFKSDTLIFFISASVKLGSKGTAAVAVVSSGSISMGTGSSEGSSLVVVEGSTWGADSVGVSSVVDVVSEDGGEAAAAPLSKWDNNEAINVYPRCLRNLGLGGCFVQGGGAANIASKWGGK